MYEDDNIEQGNVTNNNSSNNYSYNSNSYNGANSNSNPYNYSNNSYSYNQGSNGYTRSNTSYNQGSAGYNPNNTEYNSTVGTGYNQPGQQTYGTYQYSQNAYNTANQAPVKKKGAAGKVIAAICILALLVAGVGASYYAISNNKLTGSIGSVIQEEAQAETETTTETETASSAVQETETTVKSTTVSAATSAVVTDVTAVVAEVMPAMVIIHNNYTASASYFGYTQTQEATASGSGIIVGENDTELLIATNYHVIEGADSLEVIFDDEASAEAYVKGTDSDMDLAIIAVMLDDLSSDTLDAIKIATLGDSDALTLGEPAIAIGNALGYGQSVTTGVISALNREVELDDGTTREFIQTDAAINPGNSGGALLNLQGEVIGINSNKIGGETVEGMGYAIPISAAKPIIEQLMNEETKIKLSDEERGYIGISGVSVTSEVSQIYGLPQGVYVAEVSSGGGAEAAGIQKGDVIVAFEDAEITSMDDLQTRLQYYAQGTTVSVTVMRQNGSSYEEITYDVTLGGSSSVSSQDSNAAEDETSDGQYDGRQAPGKPEDRNGESSSQSQGGH